MTDDPPQENRRFHRVPFDARVEIRAGSKTYVSQLIDVSLKGVLIERPQEWRSPPKPDCTLDIQLTPEIAITMHARVAHVENDRVGFHCEHIDVNSISHLRRLVELNTVDPALLERELSALGRDGPSE